MTMKSFKAQYLYCMGRMKLFPLFGVTYATVIGILLALITLIFSGTPFTPQDLFSSGVGDLGASGLALLLGMMFFNDFTNNAAANGASRKTAVIANCAVAATISLAYSAQNLIISSLQALIGGDSESLLMYAYLEQSSTVLSLKYIVPEFFLCFAVCLCCYMVGMLICSAAYKMPRTLFTVLITLFVVCINIGLPMLIGMMESAGNSILTEIVVKIVILFLRFIGLPNGSILQGIVAFTLMAAVSGLLSWVIVRRASVKPMPIKAD